MDILEQTKENPDQVNIYSVARIFKVYLMMILTDTYGDVPYFDAGMGYYSGILNPTYTPQKDIYYDFFKELEEAGAALNTSGDAVSGDIVYDGNIEKWKRFANSLWLRAAMRLVKIEPQTAQEQINKIMANSAGLLQLDDDAFVPYMDIYDFKTEEFRRNAISQRYRRIDDYPEAFICSTWFNKLLEMNDPRLTRLAGCYSFENADFYTAGDPWSRFDALEMFLADDALKANITAIDPGCFNYEPWVAKGYWFGDPKNYWDNKVTLPQVNNSLLGGATPGYLMTYAESQWLLTEAKLRWNLASIPETVEVLYEKALRASMKYQSNYPEMKAITEDEIDAYMLQNPFPSATADRLKEVCEQIWVLHYVNGPEAFASWRRTGYPALKPGKDYPGGKSIESQTVPRRLFYPLDEASSNGKNYRAAIAAMGLTEDSWNARVWWDKD